MKNITAETIQFNGTSARSVWAIKFFFFTFPLWCHPCSLLMSTSPNLTQYKIGHQFRVEFQIASFSFSLFFALPIHFVRKYFHINYFWIGEREELAALSAIINAQSRWFQKCFKVFLPSESVDKYTVSTHFMVCHFELFCQHGKSLLRFKQGTQPTPRAWVAATSTEGFWKTVKEISRNIGPRMAKCLVFATHVPNATYSAVRVPHTQRHSATVSLYVFASLLLLFE